MIQPIKTIIQNTHREIDKDFEAQRQELQQKSHLLDKITKVERRALHEEEKSAYEERQEKNYRFKSDLNSKKIESSKAQQQFDCTLETRRAEHNEEVRRRQLALGQMTGRSSAFQKKEDSVDVSPRGSKGGDHAQSSYRKEAISAPIDQPAPDSTRGVTRGATGIRQKKERQPKPVEPESCLIS